MSLSFPSSPAVGQTYQGWVWSGSSWDPLPTSTGPLGVQVFTASGTYVPSPNMTTCMVECGGGGAAGFGTSSSAASQGITGGGGGGGAYARKFLTAAQVGASQPVSVGVGGVPGAAGANAGGAGGDTSLGALCVAKGAPASVNTGGAGGPAAGCVGDVIIAGGGGIGQMTQTSVNVSISGAGAGGSSFFGGGAPSMGSTANVSGTAAPGYCGGGQGGNSYNGGGARTGGPGGAGLCVVTEYAGEGQQIAAVAAPASSITAYWYGTVTPTALGQNPSSVSTSTGVLTFAAAHGVTTGQVGIANGTVPGGVINATPYYLRALSPTTLAMYLLLTDCYADINRVVPSGAGVAWSFRMLVYSGVVSKNMDPAAPFGAWTAHGAIFPELNLTKALASLNAMILFGGANTLMTNAASLANSWQLNVMPTIVSTTLIRFDNANWALAGGATPIGSWSQQGLTAFTIGFAVIG
jgi:hypothetical protein